MELIFSVCFKTVISVCHSWAGAATKLMAGCWYLPEASKRRVVSYKLFKMGYCDARFYTSARWLFWIVDDWPIRVRMLVFWLDVVLDVLSSASAVCMIVCERSHTVFFAEHDLVISVMDNHQCPGTLVGLCHKKLIFIPCRLLTLWLP